MERANRAANRLEQESRHRLAGAASTETIQVPVTGKGMDSKGNVYTFSGIVTVTVDAAPTPIPVTTKLTGIRNPDTALLVTTAAPGQRLVLEGELLTSETLLVAIGGERATVTRASAGMIEFVVPVVPAGKPPTLILYWLVNNNWVEKGRLPLAVQASPPTPPTPTPTPAGGSPRVQGIETSGEQIVISGSGFGEVAGRLLLDKLPVAVLSWADTRIAGTPVSVPDLKRVVVDVWKPAEGWFSEMWVLPGGGS